MSEAFNNFGPVEWFRDQFNPETVSAESMFRLVILSWIVAAVVLIAIDRLGSTVLGRSRPLAQHPPERARSWRWGRQTPPANFSLLPPGVASAPALEPEVRVIRPLALPPAEVTFEGPMPDATSELDDTAFWRLFAEDESPLFGFENATRLTNGTPPERYNPVTGRVESLLRSREDAAVLWPTDATSSLVIGKTNS